MMTIRRISRLIGGVTASAVAGLAMMIVAVPAHAVPIVGSPTGLAAPGTSLTFSEVVFPNNTTITNQFQGFGVIFSSNIKYNPQTTAFPNIVGNRLGNFFPIVDQFTVSFTSDVAAAAFAMVTNPGTSTFTALLDGAVVESFAAATNFNSASDFYGFSGITFDQIRVDVGGNNGAMLLDNLQYNLQAAAAEVPEPSSLLLFALALGGLGFMARRPLA